MEPFILERLQTGERVMSKRWGARKTLSLSWALPFELMGGRVTR